MLSSLAYPALVIVFLFDQGAPSTATNSDQNTPSNQTASTATVKPADVKLMEVEKQMLNKTNAQHAPLRLTPLGRRPEFNSNGPRARSLDDEQANPPAHEQECRREYCHGAAHHRRSSQRLDGQPGASGKHFEFELQADRRGGLSHQGRHDLLVPTILALASPPVVPGSICSAQGQGFARNDHSLGLCCCTCHHRNRPKQTGFRKRRCESAESAAASGAKTAATRGKHFAVGRHDAVAGNAIRPLVGNGDFQMILAGF